MGWEGSHRPVLPALGLRSGRFCSLPPGALEMCVCVGLVSSGSRFRSGANWLLSLSVAALTLMPEMTLSPFVSSPLSPDPHRHPANDSRGLNTSTQGDGGESCVWKGLRGRLLRWGDRCLLPWQGGLPYPQAGLGMAFVDMTADRSGPLFLKYSYCVMMCAREHRRCM